MEVFAWIPDKGYDVEPDLGVREVQFGEGVVQVQQRFLTKPKQKFNHTFTGPSSKISEIYNFLLRQRGNRFTWRDPVDKKDYIVRCTTFKKNCTGIVDTLTCEFKEEPI